ncbi:MAG: hypothetical protein AB8G22_02370 [Saprospiraceae bacterium]
MQGTREHLDDLAKSLLNEFTSQPPAEKWDDIQAELQETTTDQLFQSLKEHQVTPATRNWEKIQYNLPWQVVYRKQLLWLSRTAAVLLLAFCLPQLLKYQHKYPPVSETVSTAATTTNTTTFGQMMEQVEQEKTQAKKTTHYTLRKKSIPTTEAEQLLASILLDDEEFPDSLLDINRLRNMLKPIEPLPVISAVARIESLPITNLKVERKQPINVELEISVPLIFVEEGEAEQLIERYEKEQQLN